jgi:hypothetical protein
MAGKYLIHHLARLLQVAGAGGVVNLIDARIVRVRCSGRILQRQRQRAGTGGQNSKQRNRQLFTHRNLSCS